MVDVVNGNIRVRESWLSHESVAIAAFVLLALTIIRPISIGVAVAATIVLMSSWLPWSWGRQVSTRVRYVALATAGFLLILGVAAGWGGPIVLVAPLVLAVAFLSLRANLDVRGMRWLAAGLLVAGVAVVGAVWVVVLESPEIDVLDLHVSAADALVHGNNPYAEARAADTSPTAPPGAEVVGYPYPPLTMLAYVAAQVLFGDPRWASVIAIAFAVLLMVRPWAALTRQQSAALIALGLAVVAQPVIGHRGGSRRRRRHRGRGRRLPRATRLVVDRAGAGHAGRAGVE